MYAHVSVHSVCAWCFEIQKMVSDALELEIPVAVSYHLSPLQESQVLLAVV